MDLGNKPKTSCDNVQMFRGQRYYFPLSYNTVFHMSFGRSAKHTFMHSYNSIIDGVLNSHQEPSPGAGHTKQMRSLTS